MPEGVLDTERGILDSMGDRESDFSLFCVLFIVTFEIVAAVE